VIAAPSEATTPSVSSEKPPQRSTTSDSPPSERTSATQIRRRPADEAGPECDQDRRRVLDEERDPDLEPVDREEVEPLHECEPEDPEGGEEEELVAADPKPFGPGQSKRRDENERRARRANLAEPERRDPGREDRLCDRPVDSPEAGRGEHHRVAEQGAARAYFSLRGQAPLYHAARLSDYTSGTCGV